MVPLYWPLQHPKNNKQIHVNKSKKLWNKLWNIYKVNDKDLLIASELVWVGCLNLELKYWVWTCFFFVTFSCRKFHFLVLLVFFRCQFSFFHFSFLSCSGAFYVCSSDGLAEWQGNSYHEFLLRWKFSRKQWLWCKLSWSEILCVFSLHFFFRRKAFEKKFERSLKLTTKRTLKNICPT